MAMIAHSPVGLSWQNTTCSCPAGSSRPVNTPMAAPDTKVRPGLVGPAVLSGGVLPAVPSLTPPLLPHRDASARPGQDGCGMRKGGWKWHDRGVPSLFASYLRVDGPLAAFERGPQGVGRRDVEGGR